MSTSTTNETKFGFLHLLENKIDGIKAEDYQTFNKFLSFLFVCMSITIISSFIFIDNVRCSVQDNIAGCQTMNSIINCENLVSVSCITNTSVPVGASCDFVSGKSGVYQPYISVYNTESCKIYYNKYYYFCSLSSCCGILNQIKICPSISTTIGVVCGYLSLLFAIVQVIYSSFIRFHKFCCGSRSLQEIVPTNNPVYF